MRTSNPALNPKLFLNEARTAAPGDVMTVGGTVNKTALLLVLLAVPAMWMWSRYGQAVLPASQGRAGDASMVMPWMLGGLIAGTILAFITIFAKRAAGITAPLYAICEGLFLGGISLFFESQYPGIAPQAVGLTFGVFFVMLGVYRSGIIKVNAKFRMAVVGATGGIAIFYLISLVLGMFGVTMPAIYGNGNLGILFSLIVVGIAAFNLVLDFDFIEQGARAGAPKYMEWYGAFGLMVTLVWLYLEILRLLSKLRSRN